MMKHKRIGLAVLILMLLASAQIGFGQNANAELLDRRILNLKVKEVNVHLALSKLAGCYGAPIGLEVALTDKEPFNGKIEVDLPDGTLNEALDAIVKQDARYEWKVMDGVINVFPKSDRDNILEEMLGAQVKQFSIEKGTSLYRIRYNIVELPEIKSKLDQAKVLPMIVSFFGAIDMAPAGREFSLTVSNLPLREILNRIIREGEVKYWIVNRYGKNNENLILNF